MIIKLRIELDGRARRPPARRRTASARVREVTSAQIDRADTRQGARSTVILPVRLIVQSSRFLRQVVFNVLANPEGIEVQQRRRRRGAAAGVRRVFADGHRAQRQRAQSASAAVGSSSPVGRATFLGGRL